jgi:peptidoglycan/xylan/chitin deacetylase (PgdA/CDA1 family)
LDTFEPMNPIRRHLVPLFLLPVVVLATPTAVAASVLGSDSRPVTVVFRYDDYSARSSTELERSILDIFRRHRAHVTFSVIPYACVGEDTDPTPQEVLPLTLEKARLLKEAMAEGFLEVAQHGYSHQRVRNKSREFLGPGRRYHSEFTGVAPAVQLRKISDGKALLEERLLAKIDTFVPPWNGYDRHTLEVLAGLGFRTISAARRGPVVLDSPLRFVPETAALRDLRDAVTAARKSRDPHPLVVVLFHHYDFREDSPDNSAFTLSDLDDLIGWVSAQPDIQTRSIEEAVETLPGLDARQFYWNRNALLWQITPELVTRLRPPGTRRVYDSTAQARRNKLGMWGLVLGVYLFGAAMAGLVVAGVAAVLFPRLPILERIALPVALIGLIAAAGYAFRDLEPYVGGASVISLLLGVIGGLAARTVERRRRVRMG